LNLETGINWCPGEKFDTLPQDFLGPDFQRYQ